MSRPNAIEVILDLARAQAEAGKTFIDFGGICMDMLNVHTAYKAIGNEYWRLNYDKKKGKEVDDEVLQKVEELTEETKTAISKILNEIDEIAKNAHEAMIDHNTIKNNPMLAGLILNLHETEKVNDVLLRTAKQEGNAEVEALSTRLDEAFGLIIDVLRSSKNRKQANETILKKYGKNISSVIQKNTEILTLKNGIKAADLIGRKGSNLVNMYEMGLNVPESFFLTTLLCGKWHKTQDIDAAELEFIRMLLYAFDTDKIAIRASGAKSMPGTMVTVLNVDKGDINAVKEAIMKVVNSWDSPQAVKYRELVGYKNEYSDFGLAVILQPMIDGKKGISGIGFTQNPITGEDIINGEMLMGDFGEDLASGHRTPEKFNETTDLPGDILSTLIDFKAKLEADMKTVVEFEFVYDGDKTYIVQARAAKLTAKASIVAHYNLYERKVLSYVEAHKYINEKSVAKHTTYKVIGSPVLIDKVQPVSSGIVTGTVLFDKTKIAPGCILAMESMEENDLDCISKVDGVITQRGGYTSHPAVLCREFKKTGVIGLDISKLKAGQTITINGETGEIFDGAVEFEKTNDLADYVTRLNNSL